MCVKTTEEVELLKLSSEIEPGENLLGPMTTVPNFWCDFSWLSSQYTYCVIIVKLRQGSGKDRQGMALKAKGLKA